MPLSGFMPGFDESNPYKFILIQIPKDGPPPESSGTSWGFYVLKIK